MSIVPTSLRGYRRDWLRGDLLAGLTLAAIAIPEQLANARLTGVAPQTGFVAFVAAGIVFAVIGANRVMSVGADSTIAPMVAAAVLAVGAVGTAENAGAVVLLAVMTGAILVVFGLARLGWMARFISRSSLTGVLAGIAVTIVVHALPAALGVEGGEGHVPQRLQALVGNLAGLSLWSVAIVVGVLLATVIGARISPRLPAALVAVAAATALVWWSDPDGVATVGRVDGGFAGFGVAWPGWPAVGDLALPALLIALVCLAQTAATEEATGELGALGGSADPARRLDRDIAAIGFSNLAAGLAGAMPVNSSPPRSAILVSSGARSQVSGLVAAIVVAVLAFAAMGVVAHLPQAALAGILFYVASHLLRPGQWRAIARFDRVELAVAIVTAVVVLGWGVQAGIVAAIALSLADRIRREARPQSYVLGRVPGTGHWIPQDVGVATETVPGLSVYFLQSPLWYANADAVVEELRDLVRADQTKILVLDAAGISDVDFTGAQALSAIAEDLRERGIAVAVARASHLVRHDLADSGIEKLIGAERIYPTVAAAVAAEVGASGNESPSGSPSS